MEKKNLISEPTISLTASRTVIDSQTIRSISSSINLVMALFCGNRVVFEALESFIFDF